MKIEFWAIGKNHEPYIKTGVDEFTNRIANYYPVKWNIIPPPKNAGHLNEPVLKKKEGEMILAAMANEDYLVLMDEKGKEFSSHALSNFLQCRANESHKHLIFLIGGAFGVDETIMKRANFTWSLSLLTFPHQLVRLIIAEQLYRACTILRNEKYHHS
ncbi:MAG: 23S rRNA (pseudouridine(1915)-N(3))-methyltransferase RlmH [Flavitalea sp.]